MHPVLIGGDWRSAQSSGGYSTVDPSTGETLEGLFPMSAWADCEAALEAAAGCALELEDTPPEAIARFLEAYADRIEQDAQSLGETAARETALPVKPRLVDVELPRTTNQLRLAADAARSGVWRSPVHDDSAGLHACFGPIGPVVVFGPNNFPLAFNAISGGDFAAAIAAGNPVIAKAHPDHPETTRLLAEHAYAALAESGLPPATVQLLYGVDPDDGLRMVADERVGAVAFTGSRRGGLALKAAADAAGTPIYLEMSSVNPVFFLPGAVAQRGEALAGELAASVLLGAGQFCTCPNLFVLSEGEGSTGFVSRVEQTMDEAQAGVLLSGGVLNGLKTAVGELLSSGARVVTGGKPADGTGYRFENTLLAVSGDGFLANPAALQTEAFGPVSLGVTARDPEQMLLIAEKIEGSLTASVYSADDGSDAPLGGGLMARLRRRAGRVINDKMPTGVAVSPAMNHGGPFPASGHPGFTAVGIPTSIRRFTKLDCYDNVRAEYLPESLRASNP